MVTSETTKTIYQALIKARAEFKSAPKDVSNDYFNSKYADYQSVVDSIGDALIKHGLSFLQPTVYYNDKLHVATRIIHESGEWIECLYPVTSIKQDAQGIGSALTYSRRYSLSTLIGVVTGTIDDDGEAAMDRKATPPPQQKPVVKQAAKAPVKNETMVTTEQVSKLLELAMERNILEKDLYAKINDAFKVPGPAFLKVYQMADLVKDIKAGGK